MCIRIYIDKSVDWAGVGPTDELPPILVHFAILVVLFERKVRDECQKGKQEVDEIYHRGVKLSFKAFFDLVDTVKAVVQCVHYPV